jgi:hypothetical protein
MVKHTNSVLVIHWIMSTVQLWTELGGDIQYGLFRSTSNSSEIGSGAELPYFLIFNIEY